MEGKRCASRALTWCLVFLLLVTQRVQANDIDCDRGLDACRHACEEQHWPSYCMAYCVYKCAATAHNTANVTNEEQLRQNLITTGVEEKPISSSLRKLKN